MECAELMTEEDSDGVSVDRRPSPASASCAAARSALYCQQRAGEGVGVNCVMLCAEAIPHIGDSWQKPR
eukprot:203695-Prymnesium_polylepis.1